MQQGIFSCIYETICKNIALKRKRLGALPCGAELSRRVFVCERIREMFRKKRLHLFLIL